MQQFEFQKNAAFLENPEKQIGQNLTKIQQNSEEFCKFCLENQQEFQAMFNEKREVRERCQGVHCADLGESFPTSIYLQNVASIPP